MERILSISKKPGLFRMVNRGKNVLVVESISGTGRRMPAFATDKIISLNDITVYTETGDIPLWQVLKSIGEKENSGRPTIDFRRVSTNAMRNYFTSVLPSYDRDRVHDSDMRRIMLWYETLVDAGYTDFEELMAKSDE